MLSLTSTLLAHQRSSRRKPALAVSAAPTHFGVPILELAARPASAGVDCPVDAAANPATGAIVSARNNAGALDVRPSPLTSSWANLDTVTAGQGFALAFDEAASLFALAYGDGAALKFRTSADEGATWSAATTLVTEASAIGAVALAFDPNGDACVFYVLGASTTLKRLRRTAGAWAGAGTTWSKTGSVASLTGVAATWNADYLLVVTGTEVTTAHPRAWAFTMGDTALPPNAWGGPRIIAEADAGSTVSFSHPRILHGLAVPFATFQQVEAGNVAASRTMLTSTTAGGDILGWWREPVPTPLSTASGAGLALTGDAANGEVLLVGPTAAYAATLSAGHDLTARVVALSWRHTAEAFRLRLELDNHDGAVPAINPGYDLTIDHGYRSGSGGSAEYGMTITLPAVRVAHTFGPGRARLVVEADGPWEHLGRFRFTQAWTAPASTSRETIFGRLAGRAGIEVSSASGDRAPSTAWSDTPAFFVAPGEPARAALQRLLEPTPDFLRARLTGGLEVCTADPATEDITESYSFRPSEDAPHPILSLELAESVELNWVRAQGPDRYADAFLADGEPVAQGARFALLRDAFAGDDTRATDAATRALARARLIHPAGELVVPANVGQELFDAVSVEVSALSLSGSYRVIGLGLDYRSAVAGTPAYNSVFTLGRYD